VSARLRPYVAAVAIVQAAMLLAGCGNTPATPSGDHQDVAAERPIEQAVPFAGPKRLVLAFGDSLYAGYGLKRGESLPDAVERRLRAQGVDVTIRNAGVSGDTTSAGVRRLAYTLDQFDRAPDLVLLGLGGNDVLRQVGPAETRANMDAMLRLLQERHIPVVLTGMLAPPNLGPDYAARFNAIWPDLARKYDVALYPFILDGVIGNRTLMLPDGVHPNAQGVDRVADRVAPLVGDTLRTLPAA
jgi:acyl-CoA thioesterase I